MYCDLQPVYSALVKLVREPWVPRCDQVTRDHEVTCGGCQLDAALWVYAEAATRGDGHPPLPRRAVTAWDTSILFDEPIFGNELASVSPILDRVNAG